MRLPPFNVDPSRRARTLVAVGLLGFSSGLPLALSGGTLEAWCAVSGLSLRTIGVVKLVAIAYVFKFLWAPLVDRFRLPWLGRRRGWMLLMQLALAATLVAVSAFSPANALTAVAVLALALAAFSTTQDIAIDAYRADQLAPRDRGLGSALSVGTYRMAMLVSGGLALVLASAIGWSWTYRAMAALMVVGVVGTLLAPEREEVAAPASVLRAYVDPFREFLSRPRSLAWLALIVFYKLGTAFALSLSTTFLLRGAGYDLAMVGWVNKVFALIAMVAGAFLAGLLLERWRLWQALLGFGVLQALGTLGFLAVSLGWHGLPGLVVAVAAENFGSGLGNAAFLALLLALCNRRFSATQFALFSAIDSLPRVFVGLPSALVAQAYGWPTYFVASLVCALPGLALLLWLRPDVEKLDPASAA
ncbi:MAG: MFS transporter [Rhodanobacteraceae bacterium]